MAETATGKKFNRVPEYTRVVNGKKQVVKAHVKSNPITSRGKKK